MDIEQLKLVLEAFGSFGANGKEAFIWYLVAKTIPFFILMSAFLSIVFYVARGILRNCSSDDYFIIWRDQLRVGTGGYLSYSERDEVVAKVSQLIAESIGKNK